MSGDRVVTGSGLERTVTHVFEPDNEVSQQYDMTNGCVAISPASIESLPLNEDIVLLARSTADAPPTDSTNEQNA